MCYNLIVNEMEDGNCVDMHNGDRCLCNNCPPSIQPGVVRAPHIEENQKAVLAVLITDTHFSQIIGFLFQQE